MGRLVLYLAWADYFVISSHPPNTGRRAGGGGQQKLKEKEKEKEKKTLMWRTTSHCVKLK